jgi:Zn finger protein HypA/HybF involved in hydrogenase expression
VPLPKQSGCSLEEAERRVFEAEQASVESGKCPKCNSALPKEKDDEIRCAKCSWRQRRVWI